jgi:hypothetical protein
VDELDDAGVSPREFGSADSFQDLDLDLGRSTIDDMARRVNDCEIDVSGVFIDSLTGALPGLELSSESTTCLADQFRDSFGLLFVEATFGGEEQAARDLGEEMSVSALGACPATITELLVASIEAEGVELTPEAEQCIATEIEARGPEIGAAVLAAGEDADAANRLGAEIVTPCLALLQD